MQKNRVENEQGETHTRGKDLQRRTKQTTQRRPCTITPTPPRRTRNLNTGSLESRTLSDRTQQTPNKRSYWRHHATTRRSAHHEHRQTSEPVTRYTHLKISNRKRTYKRIVPPPGKNTQRNNGPTQTRPEQQKSTTKKPIPAIAIPNSRYISHDMTNLAP